MEEKAKPTFPVCKPMSDQERAERAAQVREDYKRRPLRAEAGTTYKCYGAVRNTLKALTGFKAQVRIAGASAGPCPVIKITKVGQCYVDGVHMLRSFQCCTETIRIPIAAIARVEIPSHDEVQILVDNLI